MEGFSLKPSPAKLDKLAPEIFDQIFYDLTQKDLCSVRLVNTSLAAAAAPFLFETIQVWINIESLATLTEISKHSVLSQHVTRIILSPLRFKDNGASVCDPGVWRRFKGEGELSSPSSNVAFKKHIAICRTYIEAQRQLDKDGRGIEILVQAFRALSRLRTVVLDVDSDIGSVQLSRAFANMRAMTDGLTCHWQIGLRILIEALYESGIRLKTLSICRHNYSRLGPHSLRGNLICKAFEADNVFNTTDFPKYAQVFSELRELKISDLLLDVRERMDPARQNSASPANAIHRLIASAPLLEKIELVGGTTSPCAFSLVFGLTLKRLRTLKFFSLKPSAAIVNQFFHLHANNLEEVELVSVLGNDEAWPGILTSLRNHETFSNLERFNFKICVVRSQRGFRDCEVQDYILGRTERNPLLPPAVV